MYIHQRQHNTLKEFSLQQNKLSTIQNTVLGIVFLLTKGEACHILPDQGCAVIQLQSMVQISRTCFTVTSALA